MQSNTQKLKVVRISQQLLNNKRKLLHSKSINYPVAHVKTKNISKDSSHKPFENQHQTNSISFPIQRTSSVNLNETIKESNNSKSSFSSTKQSLIRISNNKNQITPMNNIEDITNSSSSSSNNFFLKNENQKENKYQRRYLGFVINQICCYLIMFSILLWVLFLALIIALVLFFTQPKTTTTTTTTTTVTTTTSTSSTTSTTTSTTSTVSTTTTTTVTTADICSTIQWNQTGLVVAGTGVAGSGASQFKNSACVYVDGNYSIYVCDHHNNRIQMWLQGASAGTTVAGTSAGSGATDVQHPEYLTMDRYGYFYVAGHALSEVLRFAPGVIVGTVAAGSSTAGSANNQLKESSDVAIDDDFNLYVADPKNTRIMQWPQNATTGTIVVSNSNLDGIYGILLAPNSSNQIYLSSENKNSIYLWTFGASTPDVTLTQVNSTNHNTLGGPLGMAFDSNYNLYVADSGYNRIVMFSYNSTVGIVVFGECNTTPTITKPMDVAFDLDDNLYVVLDGDEVIKFKPL